MDPRDDNRARVRVRGVVWGLFVRDRARPPFSIHPPRLTISAGESHPVEIATSTDNPAATITVRDGLPRGIRVEARETANGPGRSLSVDIDPNLEPKDYTIAFDAFDGRRRQGLSIPLAVQPPDVRLPPSTGGGHHRATTRASSR